ncbi:MAG: class I SAM-dependent methyltransferase [Bacteroidota bacterium]
MIVDKTGFETLEVIKKAGNFNKWMFSEIETYCEGNILEIGSGIGNISQFFINKKIPLTLSDVDNDYINILQTRFINSPEVKAIFSIDLQADSFNRVYGDLCGNYDTIFMLNVLEHLEDANAAIKNCHYLIKPGGTLIVLVPAYTWLYSRMDSELGHKTRYTAGKIKTLISEQEFTITKTFYFNAIGIIAWLYGKVMRLKKIASGEMSLFDRLVGAGKIIDKLLFNKTGLSVICVAHKSNKQ